MGMTTLCYIEKDNKYLMLHRIKKEHDINKDKWIGVVVILNMEKARKTACFVKLWRKQD